MATESIWDVDAAHSSAEFSIRHMMITSVKGHFSSIAGTVTGDPDDLTTARVHLDIDLSTVDTRNTDRDNHLRSADFFDVEHFPTMTFESRSIERTGPSTYRVGGDLTIHGVTKPVTVDVTAEGQGKDPWGGTRAGFSGTTTINRKDFGLMWNVALEAGGVMVGDQVKVSVDLETVQRA
ncbi:MAG: YceI family protein [Clostridia bacterium]